MLITKAPGFNTGAFLILAWNLHIGTWVLKPGLLLRNDPFRVGVTKSPCSLRSQNFFFSTSRFENKFSSSS